MFYCERCLCPVRPPEACKQASAASSKDQRTLEHGGSFWEAHEGKKKKKKKKSLYEIQEGDYLSGWSGRLNAFLLGVFYKDLDAHSLV